MVETESREVALRPVEPNAAVKLVVSIDRDHQIFFIKASESKELSMELNQWYLLNGSFSFPDQLQPDDFVKVFVINDSHKRMDADDFEIRFKY